MHTFHGQLLIGGMTIKDLEGELREEAPQEDSGEWLLEGSVRVDAPAQAHLEINRTYRLQLDDGRAGQVIVRSLVPEADRLVAEFCPCCGLPRETPCVTGST